MTEPTVQLTDPRALRGFAHPLRMALVGLLRREGPMTATQAAEQLGESVPSCSFHLRQLAKYGLAERVPGADGREKPWQATARTTSWDNGADDPSMRAATEAMNAQLLLHYHERATAWLDQQVHESSAWRSAAGFGDAMVYLTADELAALNDRLEALLGEFQQRSTDPAARPPGARPVALIQYAFPMDRSTA
jgi:predicted ArsR family transcriptional regulator